MHEVVIVRLQDTTFYAELRVIDASQELRIIDARPSDSIALAIRCNAPIRVTEAVLTEAGGISHVDPSQADPPEEDTDTEDETPSNLVPSEDIRLEDIDADVFGKYKM